MRLFPPRYPCCNSGPIANAVTRTCPRIRRKPASAPSSALFAFLALKANSTASAQTVAANCWRDRGVRQTNWPAIRLQGTGSTSPLVVGRPRRNGSSPVTLLMHDLISHKVKHVIPGPRSGTRNPATRVDYNLDTRVCLGVVLTG